MNDFEKGFFTITPEEAAESGLKHLGHEFYTAGHWKHKILAFIYFNIPEYMRTALIGHTFKRMWDKTKK
jgi:hypothetical protein